MKRIVAVLCALSFAGCGELDPEAQAQLEAELGQSDSALWWSYCPPLFNDEAPNSKTCTSQIYSSPRIDYEGDIDWHRHYVGQGNRVAVRCYGFWAECRLEDASGHLLTWSGGGLREVPLSNGNYVYLRVRRRPQYSYWNVPTFGYDASWLVIHPSNGVGSAPPSGSESSR